MGSPAAGGEEIGGGEQTLWWTIAFACAFFAAARGLAA
jgi:hypothetical protein